jgi:hypothetical protein
MTWKEGQTSCLSLLRRLFNILNTTSEYGSHLPGDVTGLRFDGLHASKYTTLEILASLVQSIKPLPQHALGFGTAKGISGTSQRESQSWSYTRLFLASNNASILALVVLTRCSCSPSIALRLVSRRFLFYQDQNLPL